MLIHDFGLVGAEKEVHLDDNLILYIIDTLKWVKTFSKLENNIEKNGLNYHGITYFKDEGIKKLKNILFHWKNIFNLGEDVIELEGIFYNSQKKRNSKNKYSKKYIVESLEKLPTPVEIKKILDECSTMGVRKNYLISNFFIQSLKTRDYETDDDFVGRTMKNLKYLELSKEDIKEIRRIINTKFGSSNELAKYHKQLDDLRNDFAHGNISEEEFSHIKQEIKKLFDKYQDFIKIQDS